MITESHIDQALESLFEGLTFSGEPATLYDPLRYMIAIGGKRRRPKLCLTAYGLYKDELNEGILDPAAALEVFHNFTLIHDDMMDRSPLRRGVPTVWKKWNTDQALLSGDVMCIDSFRRIAKAPAAVLSDVLDLFSSTAAQICDGQQLDMEFESREEVAMSEYMQMIGLKTGVLIACAAKMGALIGGAPQEDCDNIYQYGYQLGLAFQVADDYLDAFGDEKVFGKPIGGDIVENKKSWLTTRAMAKADEGQRQSLLAAMQLEVTSPETRLEKIQRVKDIYVALNVQEDAKYEILRLTGKAMDAAASSLSGIRLETLRRFADRLVGRTQ